ncbi:DNA-binding MarR family transcriptional regulator [Sulfitobacter undariae]|uniref:DNA-binding MarR family transcriptional regulator n=1 Tax=Sulfitobacter undariae TaxID=1563671 RepID=A0A7W6H1D8_9RHOB|nr:MarR family transcriptional regulator [Sulfitobacter undariae]MBB3995450.1 DNA-binding MarR family transcriptional regulator [Sulfitobacter undariae]
MRTPIDPDSIGFLINDLARQSRAIFEHEIEAANLTVTAAEARVLAHMARTGATRQHLLADSLGMTPMSVTGFLDRLEKSELVERTPDPKDRRAKIVTLTERASDILIQISQAGRKTEQTISEGLCPKEWDVFYRTALQLRRNIADTLVTDQKDEA